MWAHVCVDTCGGHVWAHGHVGGMCVGICGHGCMGGHMYVGGWALVWKSEET